MSKDDAILAALKRCCDNLSTYWDHSESKERDYVVDHVIAMLKAAICEFGGGSYE